MYYFEFLLLTCHLNYASQGCQLKKWPSLSTHRLDNVGVRGCVEGAGAGLQSCFHHYQLCDWDQLP